MFHATLPTAIYTLSLHDASSDLQELIAVPSLPTEVEINRHRASIERQIQGYGAFLGVPFLFTSYRNAIRYLGFGPDDAMYVVLRVSKGSSVSDVKQSLQERLPEVDVLTRAEVATKPRMYWTITQGASGTHSTVG